MVINRYFKKNRIINLKMDEFIPAIKELFKNGNEIILISGWLTNDGLRLIQNELETALSKGKTIKLLVGKIFDDHDYALAKNLKSKYPNNFHFNVGNKGFIHAKIYAAISKDELLLISGSSNLTFSGMNKNLEFNTTAFLIGKDIDEFKESIDSLWNKSKNYNEIPLTDKEILTEEYVMAIKRDELKKQFEKYEIENWDYDGIEDDTLNYQSLLLDYLEKYNQNSIDASEFRKDYLFSENWAITESEGWTSLKEKVQQEDPRRILKNIMEMLKSNLTDPDEIVNSGRISGALGESILTELLHKAKPELFPILNRKSAFGFMIIDGRDFRAYNNKSPNPYATFIKAVDKVVEFWKEYLGDSAELINDKIKYRCVDILCQEMYEDKDNAELKKLWNSQDKGEKGNW